MNLPFKIALRYFFSGKVSGVVHIISGISMLGVVVGSAALIIVLSVFNGFENLVVSMYDTFDPDIKVLPMDGKFFEQDDQVIEEIRLMQGVLALSPVLEENVLARYDENQTFARIKGIEPEFLPTLGLDTTVFIGDPIIANGNFPYALVGMGVSGKLGINVHNDFRFLQLYIPKGDRKVMLNPRRAFNKQSIRTSGIFSIQREFDDKYIITPLSFAKGLVGKSNELSALEVSLEKDANLEDVQKLIKEKMGANFKVLNRFEQHSFLYRILRSEKTAVFMILTFVLLIAAFNLVASLSMLAIEKKKDITILASMGMDQVRIKSIFFRQGLMLSISGAAIGIFIGSLICLLQQHFGLVKLGGNSFVTNIYPVELRWPDVLAVFVTVLIVGSLASWLPARNSVKSIQLNELQSR